MLTADQFRRHRDNCIDVLRNGKAGVISDLAVRSLAECVRVGSDEVRSIAQLPQPLPSGWTIATGQESDRSDELVAACMRLLRGDLGCVAEGRHAMVIIAASTSRNQDAPIRLRAMLNGSDGPVVAPTRLAVKQLMEHAIDKLSMARSLLGDSQAVVRQLACREVGSLSGAGRSLLPDVIELLGDPDGNVAAAAAMALCELKPDASAIGRILEILRDAPPLRRSLIPPVLFCIGPEARPALAALAGDPDEVIRFDAKLKLDRLDAQMRDKSAP